MISVNSAAPSGSDAPGKKSRRRLAALTLLALAILIPGLGPTAFLNLLLSRWLPAEGGPAITYGQARAGWFFRWVTVTGLTVDQWPTPLGPAALSVASARLDGLSFLNFIDFLRQPQTRRAEAGFLAGEFDLRRLTLKLPEGEMAVAELAGRGLVSAPAPTDRTAVPVFFDRLDLKDLTGRAGETRLELSRLEARRLGPETLESLTVRGLNLEPGNAGRPAWALGGLTVGGLDNEAIIRALTSDERVSPLWALSFVDTLDLAQAVFTLGGREALSLKAAHFDFTETGAGDVVTYRRRLDFSADLPLLTRHLDETLRRDLHDLTGDRVNGEMELALDYQRSTGRTDIRSLRLDFAELGRLTAAGRLSGVQPLRPHLSPSQILFGAGVWRLNDLSLAFADQGFMANFYRRLDQTVFRGAPRRPTPANLDEYYLQPLARRLRDEAGLTNLPALLSEARAFLQEPAAISLTARPKEPWPVVSLANPDRYDIIEKLCLTIQVNDRAPVALTVNSGVFHERLPSAPKPMEHLFDEEDIE